MADGLGALLVADCVTTLGGMRLELDAWGIDGAYAGTQRCLAAPCGLSPATLSARALEGLSARRSPPTGWYFDLALVRSVTVTSTPVPPENAVLTGSGPPWPLQGGQGRKVEAIQPPFAV